MIQYGIDLLHPPPPQSSVSVAELLSLDSWYFWLCSGLRVLSSLPNTLFYFLPLPCFITVLCLHLPMYVSPTVSSDQSARDDLPVILCKVLELSPSITNLLGMGVPLWVSSSSSNGSSLDRPCSILFFLLRVFASVTVGASPCQSIHEICRAETNECHEEVNDYTKNI
jgi:hypothetical protein